jgi:hypothetical protein
MSAAELDDAALNQSIIECARVEAASAACDAWDSCASEVGADLVIGHGARRRCFT